DVIDEVESFVIRCDGGGCGAEGLHEFASGDGPLVNVPVMASGVEGFAIGGEGQAKGDVGCAAEGALRAAFIFFAALSDAVVGAGEDFLVVQPAQVGHSGGAGGERGVEVARFEVPDFDFLVSAGGGEFGSIGT